MLTVTDRGHVSRDTPPVRHTNTRRSALLAAADPANWHKPADCRPQLRSAIDALDEPVLLRTWGRWLVDRLGADGELYRADVGVIVRISPVSRRSTYRYLAVLEAAQIIERHTTAVMRRGKWRRTTTIRAAAQYRPDLRKSHAEPVTCDSASSGTVPTLVVNSSGPVVDQPSRRNAREPDQPAADERALLDEHWGRMARARSDVPLLRPGYSTNLTYARWELERELSAEPEPEPAVPIAAAVLVAGDGEIERMCAGFGRLPDDVESRRR